MDSSGPFEFAADLFHTVQTAGLALATDLTPPESHPWVVGLMYVMLPVGMIASALVLGWRWWISPRVGSCRSSRVRRW